MNDILKILSLAVVLVLASCSGEQQEVYPEDLAGKKALLKETQGELREASKLVAKLEKEIATLDPNAKKKLKLVTTQPVKRTTFEHFIEVQGSIEADDLVAIASETGGRVVDLRIKEGQSVRKGQLVARIDLEQVNKQIAELNTQLELAVELYERQKRLWEQKIGSEVQFLQAENNKKRLEKSLETIQLQATKSEVYAPISGVVDMIQTHAGEVAGPGTPIAMILNTNKVKIVTDVPEGLIRSVKRGAKVEAKIPALDWAKEVTITQLGRTINPTNRTLKVEANISNSNGLVKPNLLATMLIKDYEQADAIVLPQELVQQGVGGKNFVFVKSSNKKGTYAKQVSVKMGRSYEGNVVIMSGLTGSEEVIVAGARSVSDKEQIEVQK